MGEIGSHVASSIVGLIIGLMYSGISGHINRRSQRKNLAKKLADAFRFNLERIVQMKNQLKAKADGTFELPNYSFDTDPIKTLLFVGSDLLGTDAEINSYNWTRYQLDHLNMKLGYILTHLDLGTDIMQDFRDNLSREKKAIEEILSKLEAIA